MGKHGVRCLRNLLPKLIYVSSGRLCCAMNGDFEKYGKSNAMTFAWYIWEKGYAGEPIVRWFN